MSHSSLVRVNQKLAQAKFLIGVVQQSAQLKQFENASYLEAICFHLFCAYQFYLHEIAETYHVKVTQPVQNETNLISLFENKNKFPVEAQELLQIRQLKDSWLSQLCDAYQAIWWPPRKDDAKRAMESDSDLETNLIQIVSLDQSTVDLTVQNLVLWEQGLRALIIRQRETSAEF